MNSTRVLIGTLLRPFPIIIMRPLEVVEMVFLIFISLDSFFMSWTFIVGCASFFSVWIQMRGLYLIWFVAFFLVLQKCPSNCFVLYYINNKINSTHLDAEEEEEKKYGSSINLLTKQYNLRES